MRTLIAVLLNVCLTMTCGASADKAASHGNGAGVLAQNQESPGRPDAPAAEREDQFWPAYGMEYVLESLTVEPAAE